MEPSVGELADAAAVGLQDGLEVGRTVAGLFDEGRCIAGLEEEQGEGLAWFGATGEWLLTSEGRNEPLWVVGCPPPN